MENIHVGRQQRQCFFGLLQNTPTKLPLLMCCLQRDDRSPASPVFKAAASVFLGKGLKLGDRRRDEKNLATMHALKWNPAGKDHSRNLLFSACYQMNEVCLDAWNCPLQICTHAVTQCPISLYSKLNIKKWCDCKNLTWRENEVISLCETHDTDTDCGLLINELNEVEYQLQFKRKSFNHLFKGYNLRVYSNFVQFTCNFLIASEWMLLFKMSALGNSQQSQFSLLIAPDKVCIHFVLIT